MGFKMKEGSPMKRNFGIGSPVKHSGAEYKAQVKKEDGVDVRPQDVRGHDEGHRTKKWDENHNDIEKKAPTEMKSPVKHTDFKTTGQGHRYSHNSGGTHDMPFTGKWHKTGEKKEKGVTMKSPVKHGETSSKLMMQGHRAKHKEGGTHPMPFDGAWDKKEGGPKMKSPVKDYSVEKGSHNHPHQK
jgi:hypothetical protein